MRRTRRVDVPRCAAHVDIITVRHKERMENGRPRATHDPMPFRYRHVAPSSMVSAWVSSTPTRADSARWAPRKSAPPSQIPPQAVACVGEMNEGGLAARHSKERHVVDGNAGFLLKGVRCRCLHAAGGRSADGRHGAQR